MSDPKVSHLPVTPRPSIAVPVQIVMNLDGARQMTFQVGFDLDESDSAISSRLDRVFQIAERQKARYDILALRDEMEKDRHQHSIFLKNLEAVRAKFKVEQASRVVEIEEMVRAKDEKSKAGYDEHHASGRRGDYAPRGVLAGELANIDTQIAAVKGEIKKQEQEQAVAEEQIKGSVKHYEEQMALREMKIAAKQALIEG